MVGMDIEVNGQVNTDTQGPGHVFLPFLVMEDLLDKLKLLDYDIEFVSDLDELVARYTTMRVTLLQQLISDYNLVQTVTGRNTYHHFVGNGMYDSDIDILLHSSDDNVEEAVTKIMCKLDNPDILSHHDVILSSFTIPTKEELPLSPLNMIAPKIEHTRTRIDWSETGQLEYCNLVAPYLRQVREQWLDVHSQHSMSIFLSMTSNILTKCATVTNKFKEIGSKTITKYVAWCLEDILPLQLHGFHFIPGY